MIWTDARLRLPFGLLPSRDPGGRADQLMGSPPVETVSDRAEGLLVNWTKSRVIRLCLELYLRQSKRIWRILPNGVRASPPGRMYGKHLNALVRLLAERSQSFGTYFLRNRSELEVIRHIVGRMGYGSALNLCVLACSKGAEVYSILWAIRSIRSDLRITTHAIDISPTILSFAEQGIYSLGDCRSASNSTKTADDAVAANTEIDQDGWMFERMTDAELQAMFAIEGDRAIIRSCLKEGVIWLCGDASDAKLVDGLGRQDMVVANRFLCHMDPASAATCLSNAARLVKPGGYLLVSGIDLDVRTEAATRLHWHPVTDLLKETHEGDPSLRQGWPLEYWGLEPFGGDRRDRNIRYASVFQIGKGA